MTNKPDLHDVDWSTLPRPQDDGGADHLTNAAFPDIALAATSGGQINVSSLEGVSVVFAYPRTGRPDQALPDNWDMIPGARGCTPQACAFRDLNNELRATGVSHVFGLSTQSGAYQSEAASRLHLPYPLLSDANLKLSDALQLPTMNVDGMTLLKRLTMIIRKGTIIKWFYPVFPPDESAVQTLDWLNSNI